MVTLIITLFFLGTLGIAVYIVILLFPSRPVTRRMKLGCCFGFAISLLVYMYVIEPNWIDVERVTIHNARLAAVLGNTKVVQISDLHVAERPRFIDESLVRTVNGLDPDLVLITGDFVSDREGKETAIVVTQQLKAKLGKYGVPGNNDNYRFMPGEMRRLFPAAGVTILVNENRRIPLPNGQMLNLAGVNDPVTGQARIEEALAGVPTGEPMILLAHTPSFLSIAAGKGVDLLLAGHSHGGQIGIDWLVRIFKGNDPVNTMRGLYQDGTTMLYVNRGIGTTTIPLRFLCRPEVTVFTFRE